LYLLDTDHLGILQQQSGPAFATLVGRLKKHPPSVRFVSVVSFHEQLNGWQAYLKRARTSAAVVHAYGMFEKILLDFSNLNILPFETAASKRFDDLRSTGLRRIGTMDLRIAAIAMSRGCTVLTCNTVDFARVPGLQFEDWTQ
jgi:tRNA(fMet)-specific endonuclease VapC